MGDLFKSLSSGLAQFVYAWILPSALTCGVFSVLVLAHLDGGSRLDLNVWLGGAIFALATMILSVVFAYASRAIYRVLEGIAIPRKLKTLLTQRQVRRYHRLIALSRVPHKPTSQEAFEQLKTYPDDPGLIMPTRLGNALKAMETYGLSRYGLDSQSFWYELQSAASESIRIATRETRASVDFFISSIAHLALLATACLASLPFVDNPFYVTATAMSSIGLATLAYTQASANVLEWRWSIQALVNTARHDLASSFGLTLPSTMADERKLWEAVSELAHHGPADHYLKIFDANRRRTSMLAPTPTTPVPD